jgi:two-component system response regulator FixJ
MSLDPKNAGTVHVVDDDKGCLQSLLGLMKSVGYRAEGHATAVDFLREWRPGDAGCVITDMRMPQMSGIELLQHLRHDGMDTPVILVSAHATVATGVRAMKLGALDFLEKPVDEQTLLDLVNQAVKREWQRRTHQAERDRLQGRLGLLSDRERQVLRSILGGLPNRDIAHLMGISPKTVDTYRSRILDKTGADRMGALCREIKEYQFIISDELDE